MSRALDADIGALLARVAQTAILPRYQHLSAGEITNKAIDASIKSKWSAGSSRLASHAADSTSWRCQ